MKKAYARTLFTILFIGSSVNTTAGFCEEGYGYYSMGLINEFSFLAVLILLIMAACAAGLIVERWLTLTVASSQSRAFQSKVAEALYFNRVEEAKVIAGMYPRSPVACVVNRCLHDDSPSERERAIFLETCEIKRRLWALGAIGWTAPLIGIFFAGTRTAEELLPFSIIIAVPTIWAHRYFSDRVETLVLEMDKLSLGIIDRVTGRKEKPVGMLPISRYATERLDRHPTPQT